MKISEELDLDCNFGASKQFKEIMMKKFEEMLDMAIIQEGTMFNRDYGVSIRYQPWSRTHDIRWESEYNGERT